MLHQFFEVPIIITQTEPLSRATSIFRGALNIQIVVSKKLKLIAIKEFLSLVFSVFRLFEGRKVLEKCKRHLKLFDDNLVEAAAVSTGGFSIMATPNIRAALKRLVHSHYSNEGLPIVAKVED